MCAGNVVVHGLVDIGNREFSGDERWRQISSHHITPTHLANKKNHITPPLPTTNRALVDEHNLAKALEKHLKLTQNSLLDIASQKYEYER